MDTGPRRSDVGEKTAAALRGTLGWVWTVFGPFLGLVLITVLFACLTRDSGSFLTRLQLADDRRPDGDRRDGRAGDDDHHDRRRDRPVGRLERGAGDGRRRRCWSRDLALADCRLALAAGILLGRALRAAQRRPDHGAGRGAVHHHAGEPEGLPRPGQVALDEHAVYIPDEAKPWWFGRILATEPEPRLAAGRARGLDLAGPERAPGARRCGTACWAVTSTRSARTRRRRGSAGSTCRGSSWRSTAWRAWRPAWPG